MCSIGLTFVEAMLNPLFLRGRMFSRGRDMRCLFLLVVVSVVSCGGGGAPSAIIQDVAPGDEGISFELDLVIPYDTADDAELWHDPGAEDFEFFEMEDGSIEALQCPGFPGCPCEDNNDCFNRLCIETRDGFVCGTYCEDDRSCPEGFKCVQMSLTGGDAVYVCVDPFARLCRFCLSDVECVPSANVPGFSFKCIEIGPEGSVCSASCSEENGCPNGYSCDGVAGLGTFCLPTGECECKEKDKTAKTRCYVENEFGRCYGERTCMETCNARTPEEEKCNSIDDNCNGIVDEESAQDCRFYHKDEDGDGFGVQDDKRCLCAPSGIYSATQGNDCDDSRASVNPSAKEVCGNSIDDNCNGETDEPGCTGCVVFFMDVDQDGYGQSGADMCLSEPQGQYTASVGGDCNDFDPNINPGATEICNGIDDNCNSGIDEEGAIGCQNYYYDLDRDGYGTSEFKCLCSPEGFFTAFMGNDCDDTNALVNPGADEACNGKDDNCNGATDEEIEIALCQENGYRIYYYDGDGDGYGLTDNAKCLCAPFDKWTALSGEDCDDSSSSINPRAKEVCNFVDDNCNGTIDEGCEVVGFEVIGVGAVFPMPQGEACVGCGLGSRHEVPRTDWVLEFGIYGGIR